MIFDKISNELFDYRIFLIRYNLLFNSSRLIKIHDKLIKDLKKSILEKSIKKLIKILKDYRKIVKIRDFCLYEKLVIKHNKLLKKLIKKNLNFIIFG